MREVCPPFPTRVESVFTLKKRAIKAPPEEKELRFESGGRHAHAGVSNFPHFPPCRAIRQRKPPPLCGKLKNQILMETGRWSAHPGHQ